jgi:hypothetical protein
MRGFVWGALLGAVLTPAIAAGVFLLGWFPVAATSDPPRWERYLAHRAFNAGVARQAPRVQNPVAATSDNLRAGMKFYREGCARVPRRCAQAERLGYDLVLSAGSSVRRGARGKTGMADVLDREARRALLGDGRLGRPDIGRQYLEDRHLSESPEESASRCGSGVARASRGEVALGGVGNWSAAMRELAA